MPAKFLRVARSKGAVVRTLTLSRGRYIRVARRKGSKHWERGEVKVKKGK